MTKAVSDTLFFELDYRSNLISHAGKAYLIGMAEITTSDYKFVKDKIFEFNPSNESWSVRTTHSQMDFYYPKGVIFDNNIYLINNFRNNNISEIDLETGMINNVLKVSVTDELHLSLSIDKWKEGLFIATHEQNNSNNFYHNIITNDFTALNTSDFYNGEIINLNERIFLFDTYTKAFYEYLP